MSEKLRRYVLVKTGLQPADTLPEAAKLGCLNVYLAADVDAWNALAREQTANLYAERDQAIAERNAARAEVKRLRAWDQKVFEQATAVVQAQGGIGEGGHTIDRLLTIAKQFSALRTAREADRRVIDSLLDWEPGK